MDVGWVGSGWHILLRCLCRINWGYLSARGVGANADEHTYTHTQSIRVARIRYVDVNVFTCATVTVFGFSPPSDANVCKHAV